MMPEYFEFYNPVKIMCGEAALENIPYELTRLGAHKIFVLILSLIHILTLPTIYSV